MPARRVDWRLELFERAVAAAIFGFVSGAALATVVGVFVEVPVMLSVVAIVNLSKAGTSAASADARSRASEVSDLPSVAADAFAAIDADALHAAMPAACCPRHTTTALST